MTSSGEVWIAGRIAELARRCGISPVVGEVDLIFNPEAKAGEYYTLSGISEVAQLGAEEVGVAKMWSMLGLGDSGLRRFGSLTEVEEVVERALSLAPRSHLR